MFSQKSKLTTTKQDVAGAPQKILVLKTRVLGMCNTNNPGTFFEGTHNLLVGLCLSLWTDSMSLHACPKPPTWQSMPASGTRWHRIVVIYTGFEESEWCQLGLGNWLASQSPNQVDKGQVAPASRQAAKNLARNLAKCVAWPSIALQIQWFWLVLCNLCQQCAQLDNSWVQYIPTSPN